MTPDLIKRHAVPVPRYTSYPPATQFSPTINASTYRAWLSELPDGAALSLYFHIPFCRQLCWYCGCSTRATRREEPVNAYLAVLIDEIENVAELIHGRQAIGLVLMKRIVHCVVDLLHARNDTV